MCIYYLFTYIAIAHTTSYVLFSCTHAQVTKSLLEKVFYYEKCKNSGTINKHALSSPILIFFKNLNLYILILYSRKYILNVIYLLNVICLLLFFQIHNLNSKFKKNIYYIGYDVFSRRK